MGQDNNFISQQNTESQKKDKAIRLFSFLRDLTKLRTKEIRSSDDYEMVIWLQDIPKEKECDSIAWRGPSDEDKAELWLSVLKPKLKAPPQPPKELERWLIYDELYNSLPGKMPGLNDRIVISEEPEQSDDDNAQQTHIIYLKDNPTITKLWEKYIEDGWLPWSEEDQRVQKIQKVYTDLFTMYQKQQTLGEAYEVVLGLGNFTWKSNSAESINRHIIIARTSLMFNSVRGLITVGPAGEGAKPVLEQDMLEPQERPDVKTQQFIEQELEKLGDSIWDGTTIHALLKSWINSLSPRAQYVDSLTRQSKVDKDPLLHFAPALILRKRTERSLLKVYEEILEELQAGGTIPTGIEQVITIVEDVDLLREENIEEIKEWSRADEIKEIYFPLPANEEQLKIAQSLPMRKGLLVQGPPGTGKSHTIVNIVCHLLAEGKKVLVTSHTARALKVLHDKFPKEVSALCVNLLGDDIHSMKALEDSVSGITTKRANWDSDRNTKDINIFTNKLDEQKRKESSIIKKLQAIREKDTYRHPPLYVGGYEGTAQSIAKELKEDEEHFGWLGIKPIKDVEPPLNNQEAKEFLYLARALAKIEQDDLEGDIVDKDIIINPHDFAELIRIIKEHEKQYALLHEYKSDPFYAILLKVPTNVRESFAQQLTSFLNSYERVLQHPNKWLEKAVPDILSGNYEKWQQLNSLTNKYLSSIETTVVSASERTISGHTGYDYNSIKADASALVCHLENGGKLGFAFLRPLVVKKALYIIRDIQVDGCSCDKKESLLKLIEWLSVWEFLEYLKRLWCEHINIPQGGFISQKSEYHSHNLCLSNVLDLASQSKALQFRWQEIAPLHTINWTDIIKLRFLLKLIEAIRIEESFHVAKLPYIALQTTLQKIVLNSKTHSIMYGLLHAVDERDIVAYADLYQALSRLYQIRSQLQKYQGLLSRFQKYLPSITEDILTSREDQIWDKRLDNFVKAWNWARTDAWLKELMDPKASENLTKELDKIRIDIAETIRNLVVAKAWAHCFESMNESERQNLMAWKEAMRRLGKGTGKHARMHREAARRHMEQCRSAIPAWIMPVYRVAETITPHMDLFDTDLPPI